MLVLQFDSYEFSINDNKTFSSISYIDQNGSSIKITSKDLLPPNENDYYNPYQKEYNRVPEEVYANYAYASNLFFDVIKCIHNSQGGKNFINELVDAVKNDYNIISHIMHAIV